MAARQAKAPAKAADRVLDPLHGDAVPARVRRGDGLLGELGGVAARRHRRPAYYLKRYLMFGRVGLVALHFVSRHGLRCVKALTPLLLIASFGSDDRGDAARHRRDGERRDPLARRRPAAVPALGAAEVRAGPLRAPSCWRRARSAIEHARRAGQAAADRGRRRLRAADEAAGHGHGARHLLRDRRAAGRRRRADAAPRRSSGRWRSCWSRSSRSSSPTGARG